MKTTKHLDVVTNVAIVISAIVFLAVGLRYFSLTSNSVAPAGPPVYNPGDLVDPVPGVSYDGTERTVLLFLSSTCIYCTESMPFYRLLKEQQREMPSQFRMVAVSREAGDVLSNYLHSNALTVDQVATLEAGQPFRLRLTPTLVLVDGNGRATRSWVGALSEDNRAQVLQAIAG